MFRSEEDDVAAAFAATRVFRASSLMSSLASCNSSSALSSRLANDCNTSSCCFITLRKRICSSPFMAINVFLSSSTNSLRSLLHLDSGVSFVQGRLGPEVPSLDLLVVTWSRLLTPPSYPWSIMTFNLQNSKLNFNNTRRICLDNGL